MATYGVRRVALRVGLIDRPGHRKVHITPTPLGGGIGIWLGLVLPLAAVLCLAWTTPLAVSDGTATARAGGVWPPSVFTEHADGIRQQTPRLAVLLAAATLLVWLGLMDDRRGLDWRPRMAVQALVAALVVWAGFRLTFYIEVPWLSAALSVMWIVTLINTFNMLDNMDGLSAGVAAIVAAILATVLLAGSRGANAEPQLFVAGLLLLFTGSLIGFLWHNRPPARLFMGDSGSYLIGFWVAVTTMMATYTGESVPTHAVLAPLCVLAVPLYDTASVILIRLREGRSPFVGDKSHFSHRLVDLGMTKGQAVLTIYLATATCGLGAFLLHEVNTLGAAIVVLIVLCVLALVAVLETTARRAKNDR